MDIEKFDETNKLINKDPAVNKMSVLKDYFCLDFVHDNAKIHLN
jgi:hypothetical protein